MSDSAERYYPHSIGISDIAAGVARIFKEYTNMTCYRLLPFVW